jgi:hypothetical protein
MRFAMTVLGLTPSAPIFAGSLPLLPDPQVTDTLLFPRFQSEQETREQAIAFLSEAGGAALAHIA